MNEDMGQNSPMVELPKLRLFSVVFYNPLKDDNVGGYETQVIEAHYVQALDSDGEVWGFFQYSLAPNGAPVASLKKLRSQVISMDDESMPQDSPLILH